VVIDVANPDLKLKPGMTTNLTAVIAESDDGLKIPNAALRFAPPKAQLNFARATPSEREAPGGSRHRLPPSCRASRASSGSQAPITSRSP